MHDYRQRIYQRYLEAGATIPPAEKLAELQRRAPYLEKLIREHFPEDRATASLDLGCGAGAIEYFARRHGYNNIVGVDRSPQQVAAARSLGLTGVREGDLLATLKSLAGESQGLVIAFDVLEHFAKDELLALVDQVARVLKAGENSCCMYPMASRLLAAGSATPTLPTSWPSPASPWRNCSTPAALRGWIATKINQFRMGSGVAAAG